MSELVIDKITLGVCATNCYFIHRKDSVETVVIDPADRGRDIYEHINRQGLKPLAILITHGHFDHISGVKELKEASGAQVYVGAEDKDLMQDPESNVSAMFGYNVSLKADTYLKDNEVIELAGIRFKVLYTPGHTKGAVAYYIEEENCLFSGDTLFYESVGRTDFPTGSMANLERSVKERLFVLPDDTVIYPGHGCATSIGHEREENPFLS